MNRSDRRLAARETAKQIFTNGGPNGQTVHGAMVQASAKTTIYPFAEDLEAYNRAIPNGAERLFNNFDRQASHRQEVEKQVIASNIKQAERGQLLGFGTLVVALVIAGYLAINGHDAVAGVIVTVVLAGGFSAFISGKVQQNRDLKRKQESPQS